MRSETFPFTKKRLSALKPADTPAMYIDEGSYKGAKVSCRVMPGGARTLLTTFYMPKRPGQVRPDQRQMKIMDLEEFLADEKYGIDQLRADARDMVKAAKKDGVTPRQKAALAALPEAPGANRIDPATVTIAQAGASYLRKLDVDGSIRGESTRRAKGLALERAAAFLGRPAHRHADTATTARSSCAPWSRTQSRSRRPAAGRRTGRNRVGGRVSGKHPGHQQAASTKSHVRQVLLHAVREMGVDCRTDIFDGFDVKKNPPKRGAMTSDERTLFFAALAEWERPHSNITGRRGEDALDTADLIRLAYLAGGRGKEWRMARWGQVQNLDAPLDSDTPPTWSFEIGERKQGTAHVQALDAEAVAVLKRVRERRRARWGEPRAEDCVFPSIKARLPHEAPRNSYQAAFNRVMEIAGLNDGKDYATKLSPHRVFRASRITQLRDEEGWSADDVADHLGMTQQVVESVYYVQHNKVAKSAARARSLTNSGVLSAPSADKVADLAISTR
jgi:integrase